MRIVMKNRLGCVLAVQETFHGQDKKVAFKKMINEVELSDGDTFVVENDEEED